MSKKKKGNGHHHLTLSDRIYIEQELIQRSSFRSIGEFLGKDPSTISKEVKLHRFTPHCSEINYPRCVKCRHYSICATPSDDYRSHHSYYYSSSDPGYRCRDYDPHDCHRLDKPPYVCNGCDVIRCGKVKYNYSAQKAQRAYEKRLSESRQGINMTQEELKELNDLISPLILKGQPLSHIFAVHADEIPVCRRTLYNYLDQKIFQARNIDLPRRVRYKKRKKRAEPRVRNIEQVYRNKRTYKDFEKFMEGYPDTSVVETC